MRSTITNFPSSNNTIILLPKKTELRQENPQNPQKNLNDFNSIPTKVVQKNEGVLSNYEIKNHVKTNPLAFLRYPFIPDEL